MLALLLVMPAIAIAQTAPAAGGPQAEPITAASERAASASLAHAAAKGVTLKIGTGLAAMAVFYAGTGSVAASSVLSTIIIGTSYTVFVANDYIWDHYFPNTNVAANNQSFSTLSSLGRNTLKFLTFKPSVLLADWTAIYLYTGSWVATFAMGSAWSLVTPLVFYGNNVGWDWYDWWSTTGPSKAPAISH